MNWRLWLFRLAVLGAGMILSWGVVRWWIS